jgi:hypothetical protein
MIPMTIKSFSLRYTLFTSRLDQLWLPGGLWLLFVVIAAIFHGDQRAIDMASGFLGVVLPLLAGILGAYAFLDDPALELQFATPRSAWRSVAERLGLVMVEITVAAVAFQVFTLVIGIDLSHLGGLAGRQLAWLLPSLAMLGLGSFGAFALAQTTGGALLVGLVWIVQLILHGWIPDQAAARPFFLFFRVFSGGYPGLAANQAVIAGSGAVFLLAAWALLRKQERYI